MTIRKLQFNNTVLSLVIIIINKLQVLHMRRIISILIHLNDWWNNNKPVCCMRLLYPWEIWNISYYEENVAVPVLAPIYSRHWDSAIKLWRHCLVDDTSVSFPGSQMRSMRSAGTKRPRLDRIWFTWTGVYEIAWCANLCAQEILFIRQQNLAGWRVAILRVCKTVCFFSQLLPLSTLRSTAWSLRQRAATTIGHVFLDVY